MVLTYKFDAIYKVRMSKVTDMVSDFENIDVLSSSENANPIERILASTINGFISNNDTEALSQQRRNSSQENEIRDFSDENTIPRKDRLFGSRKGFSNEYYKRLSLMDSLMSVKEARSTGP